tara:strand:- start:17 stop:214 length:198 start_codon:yes stop_codon:yes gene_type:complete
MDTQQDREQDTQFNNGGEESQAQLHAQYGSNEEAQLDGLFGSDEESQQPQSNAQWGTIRFIPTIH